MSSASPFRNTTPDGRPARSAAWLESKLAGTARFAGFWSAVGLPFALLALVVTGAAAEQPVLFVALVVANCLGLRLGHAYNRD